MQLIGVSSFAELVARIVKAAVEQCVEVGSAAHIVVQLLAMATEFLSFMLADCSIGFI